MGRGIFYGSATLVLADWGEAFAESQIPLQSRGLTS